MSFVFSSQNKNINKQSKLKNTPKTQIFTLCHIRIFFQTKNKKHSQNTLTNKTFFDKTIVSFNVFTYRSICFLFFTKRTTAFTSVVSYIYLFEKKNYIYIYILHYNWKALPRSSQHFDNGIWIYLYKQCKFIYVYIWHYNLKAVPWSSQRFDKGMWAYV
jgi:hypothetical protein